MISLPTLDHLGIDDYGLYPGTEKRPGLSVRFKPGLTLILGANGLGKTTLINIVYRMLTGTADIPNLEAGGPLGNRRLDTRPLSPEDRRTFAIRVVDRAANATATLSFILGGRTFKVSRALSTLRLTALAIDDIELPATEESFESQVLESAGLSAFGDWILVLRHLVFYFEDRRALVWDATAQRQLLRLLFLPPDKALTWTILERGILELDSLVRNIQYSLNKEARQLGRQEKLLGGAAEVRQQLRILQDLQADEEGRLDELNEDLIVTSARRERARINALTAQQGRESAANRLEQLQLQAVQASFPSITTTARYVLSQLLADGVCIACGTHVPEVQARLEQQVQDARCPVCGSEMHADTSVKRVPRLIKQSRVRLAAADEQLQNAELDRADAEREHSDLVGDVSATAAAVAERASLISELIQRLPPDEREVHEHRSQLSTLEGRLQGHRTELASRRSAFAEFVAEVNQGIASNKEDIKGAFDHYAHGFLLERVELVWQPRRDRVGETGELIEFAAFELAMSGAGFSTPVRRSGPDAVSESQREFIDLSFRMALMAIAGVAGGSLVIDAPESSLDAVFVKRAAEVLARYANSDRNNRLVITSNLIDGDLIPQLLARASISSNRDSRVVDLLTIAAPTAATRQLHDDYVDVRQRLFARSRETTI